MFGIEAFKLGIEDVVVAAEVLRQAEVRGEKCPLLTFLPYLLYSSFCRQGVYPSARLARGGLPFQAAIQSLVPPGRGQGPGGGPSPYLRKPPPGPGEGCDTGPLPKTAAAGIPGVSRSWGRPRAPGREPPCGSHKYCYDYCPPYLGRPFGYKFTLPSGLYLRLT